MKKISKFLYYNDEYLDSKIPDSTNIKGNQDADIPFMILENLLSPTECDAIVSKLIKKGPYWDAAVVSEKKDEGKLNKKARNTMAFTLDVEDVEKYKKIIEVIKPQIEDFFKIILGSTTGLQTLGYGKDHFYKLHTDNCTPIFENGEFIRWSHTIPHRKITTILFLTESVQELKENDIGTFIGGQVKFHYLKDQHGNTISVFPKKGTLIAFPSGPHFSHSVENVEDGFRVSIVEWYDGVWNF